MMPELSPTFSMTRELPQSLGKKLRSTTLSLFPLETGASLFFVTKLHASPGVAVVRRNIN
jgi:hypothetical protein